MKALQFLSRWLVEFIRSSWHFHQIETRTTFGLLVGLSVHRKNENHVQYNRVEQQPQVDGLVNRPAPRL